MPGQFALLPTLTKLWHAPDHFRIMDPLPSFHRRGIIAGVLFIVVGVLLPATDAPVVPISRSHEASLNLPAATNNVPATSQQITTPATTTPPMVESPPRYNEPQPTGNTASEPVLRTPEESIQPDSEDAPSTQPRSTATQQAQQPKTDGTTQWHTWRIEPGKTLAQVFRDHSLPPTDVYAMARVEGADKPLSTLQSGQEVKVRINANGTVTGLIALDSTGKQVLFTRQANGQFIRAR